jgi:hypothetical protein
MKHVTAWKLFTPIWYNLHGWRFVLHLEVEPFIYQRKENKGRMHTYTKSFSSSQASGTAKGNSKDDLSEILFVFGMQVSPSGWYFVDEKYCKNLFLKLAK